MDKQFLLPLIAGSFVGASAGYIGSLMISRQMALVGDALGHVALPGMGLALLLNLDPGLGAMVFLILGILLIWKLAQTTILSLETLAGILFVSSLAIGFLITPEIELLESLIGDLSKLSLLGVAWSVLISILVFMIVKKIYPGMMLINISEELAFVEGITVKRYNLYYLICVALIIAIGVKVTGSLLVGALVIVPPATARILSVNLNQYVRLSIVIGIASNMLGILLAKQLLLAPGPAIILTSVSIFLAAFIYKRLR